MRHLLPNQMYASAIVLQCQYFKKRRSVLSCASGNARVSEAMSTATEVITKPAREPAYRKPNQTRAARRRRELIDGLTRDLGHAPNTAERELILQAADAILSREAMMAAAARGEPVSQDALLKIS